MFVVFFSAFLFAYTYSMQRKTDSKLLRQETHFRNQSATWHSEQKKWESEYGFVKQLAESNAEEIEIILTTHLAEMSRISEELIALSKKLEKMPGSTVETRLLAHQVQELEQTLDRLRSGLYVRKIWDRSSYYYDPYHGPRIYEHDLQLESAKVTILAMSIAAVISLVIWRFYFVGGTTADTRTHS